MTLCTTPELACEVTLQPVQRFPLDAAILFSDILTIPDAMGLGLYFSEGEGPRFKYPVQTEATIRKLEVPDPEDKLHFVMDTIRLTRQELDGRIPLIGFSGSPWTLATYMVEGESSRDFCKVKGLIYEQPSLAHHLLTLLADAVTRYLNAQIAAGVEAVMIFDTWGGVLNNRDFLTFSLAYMKIIVANLNREHMGQKVPVIFFSKGCAGWLQSIAGSGCDAVGLDWIPDIGKVREQIGQRVALQGNMDPCMLSTSPERIREEVKSLLEAYGNGPGHVFNLGHGIQPHIDPSHVAVLVDAVHELSQTYHQADE